MGLSVSGLNPLILSQSDPIVKALQISVKVRRISVVMRYVGKNDTGASVDGYQTHDKRIKMMS